MKVATSVKSDLSTEFAGLLARGYIRLTEKRHASAISEAGFRTEEPLDLSAKQSVHGSTESPERRPTRT